MQDMAESQKISYPSSTTPKSHAFAATATGNDRIFYPHNTARLEYPSQGSFPHRSYSADDFSFETTLSGRFVLKVYKASVTRLDVDVIVNAAKDTLVHGGGVAKVIADAAGYDLERESKSAIDKHGRLPVSSNIVTTAGKLPYRKVIHAVGPVWHAYRDKVACLDDLYDCVYNILDTCKRWGYNTVGMTAISAGIFAVPKELCADMYVHAAANFSNTLLPWNCPTELHIIDVDTSILRLVMESVQRWRKDPESLNHRLTLPQFLKDNPHHASHSHSSDEDQKLDKDQGQNFRIARNKDSLELATRVERIKDYTFSWGGVAKQFMVDNQVKVKIYQGDICKVKYMDAIVCGVNKSLEPQGPIAEALKTAGGDVYRNSYKQMVAKRKKGHVKCSDVFKCDGGNLVAKYALHVVINKVVEAETKETDAYQDCIASVLTETQRNRWKRIAIPLIGTGTIQTNKRKLKLCGAALLKAIYEFIAIHGDTHEIIEIYLVNKKHEVDSALVEVFDDATDLRVAASSRKPKRNADAVPDRSNGHAGAARGAAYRNGSSSRSRVSYPSVRTVDRTKWENGRSYNRGSRRGQSKDRAVMSVRYDDEFESDNDKSRADERDERASRRYREREIPEGNLKIIDD